MKKKLFILLVVASMVLQMIGFSPISATSVDEYSQFASKNIAWVGGNINASKAYYIEGMSVPQRLILADVDPAESHSITLSYGFTKNTKYAYDFLTGWGQAVEAAADNGSVWSEDWMWLGISQADWPVHVAVEVPEDAFAGADRLAAFEAVYGNRMIDVYANGGTLENVQISIDPTLKSNKDDGATSDVYWTLSWTGTAKEVMVLYAGHIAVGLEYPPTGLGWGGRNGSW